MQQDKVIEVIATSPTSFADALRQGVEEATRAVRSFDEAEIAGPLSEERAAGAVRYKVVMHIDFEIEAADDAPTSRPREAAVGELNPGDEVPAGTRGAGENICPTCSGSGEIRGRRCATCGGSGIVIEAVGGA
jgi:flavin-binding protein dodecin